MSSMKKQEPDKTVSGICGLFCPSCSLYIGTTEEPKRLDFRAKDIGRPVSDMLCKGCRSETVSFFCKSCVFKTCAGEKGIEFCSSCDEYPCAELREFQKQYPHRAELWESLDMVKREGFEAWFENRQKHHSCGACHTVNAVYEEACRKCGNTPSSPFFEKNRGAILPFIKK